MSLDHADKRIIDALTSELEGRIVTLIEDWLVETTRRIPVHEPHAIAAAVVVGANVSGRLAEEFDMPITFAVERARRAYRRARASRVVAVKTLRELP